MLQRQGEIDADGQPLAPARTQQPRPAARQAAVNRTGFRTYFREVKNEMRKVNWPSRMEVRNYSIVVLFALLFVGALIFVLDTVLSQGAVFLFK